MTEQQLFIKARSREARHLFCSLCGHRPPQFVGGVCDVCGDELPSRELEAAVRSATIGAIYTSATIRESLRR